MAPERRARAAPAEPRAGRAARSPRCPAVARARWRRCSSGPAASRRIRSPSPPSPRCCPGLSAELSELAELRSSLEELQASLGELLEGYRGALIQALAASAPPLGATTRGNEFTLVAGPFVALESVREFERTLLALPAIEQVAIRGYEGSDRAVLDVRLAEPNIVVFGL